MNEIDRIRHKKKSRKSYTNNKKEHHYLYGFVIKLLVVTVITLSLMIAMKKSKSFKEAFYNKVYETNISFAKINNMYQKYLGSFLPFDKILKEETVFNEELKYESISKYLDGASLKVSDNYLMPVIQSGLVVFIGDKEGYNNTVIIQGVDGVDIWYGNIDNTSVKLYDYVDKGSLLGTVKDSMVYILFKKEGKILDYEEYI